MQQKLGKAPHETAIEDHTYRVFPNDLNSQGTVFGGLIMSIMDNLAHIVAERHSQKICVTASADSISFIESAGQGDNLIFKVSVNRAWKTSMEIGVKVISEHRNTLAQKHISSCYLTFVALDENKKPTLVPPVTPLDPKEVRRFEEAEKRRQDRLRHKK
ncbi:acyl-CoA thioesterase [Candidatus Aerophobetes bacterium]|uniref:Acyl-CoA thioesterase n=1 Tax=Aerophobetes bacterium TaxID=2030807 RepID=A0A2A4X7Q5_UNCAE|nr:MAG: acyl-CoA thioesterase [Candidatus Aerophobetes bacterium]